MPILNIMQKLKNSFKAVLSGEASNQQYIIVFFTILPVTVALILFFLLKK
jgi:hypothetical protein